MTAFRPSTGPDLVEHVCARYSGAVYVSAGPSRDGDEYVVPGCGCRPDADWWQTPAQVTENRAQVLADFRATKRV